MLDALVAPRRRAHGSGLAVALALHAAVIALVLLGRPRPRVAVDVELEPPIVKRPQNGGRSTGSAPAPPHHDVPRATPPRVRVHPARPAPEPAPSTEPVADEPPGDEPSASPVAGGDANGDGTAGLHGDGSADGRGDAGPGEIVDATGVVRPTPRCAPPRMPEAARRMGITGAVVARYVVEPDGTVSSVEIVNPSAPATLIDAVRAWLSACRFEPASIGGQTARVRMTQPFLFKLL
jgi:protein TonB